MSKPHIVDPIAVSAVLFDLDGTLVDTVPDLHVALCAMLRDLNRPEIPIESTRKYVGRGMRNLIKRVLAGTQDVPDDGTLPPPEAIASFRRNYARVNGQNSSCYPGVVAGLEALKANNIPLALITNKSEAFVHPLLNLTGLTRYFDLVVSGDLLSKLKPDPMAVTWGCGRLGVFPADTVYIGDSINDSLAAHAAGCRLFLVNYGYNEGRNVQELECDAIVSSIEEAAKLIRHNPFLTNCA